MAADIELYEIFFQRDKPYYADKWTKFRNGEKLTFNFFAFLLGVFWFMYRKMYIEAAIIVAAIIFEGYLEALILPNGIGQDTKKAVSIVTTLTIATTLGFLGNYFYLRKADKEVQKAKSKYLDNEQQMVYLKKKGGISFISFRIILGIVILFLIYNKYMIKRVLGN